MVLFAACASIERLTVSEYAEFCADGVASARTLIEPESVTWGDLIRLGEPSLERLRAVEPPGELAEFHRASIKTLDFVVGVAEEHPAEEACQPACLRPQRRSHCDSTVAGDRRVGTDDSGDAAGGRLPVGRLITAPAAGE